MNKRSPTVRGLTLIETLVTLGIFALVMTAVVSSILMFYRANTSSLEQSYQIDSARRGIESLVQDLREATHGDDGAYPLGQIASSSITFFSDVDSDSTVERISYSLLGTRLARGTLDSSGTPPVYLGSAATSSVSEYVRNREEGQSLFRYFDADGEEITDYSRVGDVRFVEITLVVNVQPIRAPEEFTLRSSATLRNLR